MKNEAICQKKYIKFILKAKKIVVHIQIYCRTNIADKKNVCVSRASKLMLTLMVLYCASVV